MEPATQGWRTIDDLAPATDRTPDTRAAARSAPPGPLGRPAASLVLAAVLFVFGLVAVVGVVIVAGSSGPSEVVIDGAGVIGVDTMRSIGADGSAGRSLSPVAVDLIVDVEGAVARPGLYRLPPGSRVGDAIAAAGGFGMRVDAAATAQRLNLAAALSDGDKVQVPSLGEAMGAAPTTSDGSGAGDAGGLIDINTADGPALESLPGIGPVTAGAIIAARETAPFATVDELLGRGVVGPSTFEQIRDLVTVGP